MNAICSAIQTELKLPSPPAIAVRILEAVNKEETSYEELGRIISTDPALSTRILQVANSSFYGLPSRVDSIQRAMAILGCNALKNIALSFVIAKEMRTESAEAFDFDIFWKRSVTAGVSAGLIASLIGNKSDDIFVTALLQDIGIVMMYMCKPDKYLKVLDEKKATGKPVVLVERALFGFDHQDVGMNVLKSWGLPSTIFQPIGYHHQGRDCPSDHSDHAAILMLSDKMSSIYHGNHSAEKLQEIKTSLTSRYGVESSRIEALVDTVADETVQALSFFDIDPGRMKPFSLMIQEANEELGKLNLSYEHLVIELKQAKETAENLARELQSANTRLRGMAFQDGLTGLFNHRFFQESMDKELSKAIRYQRPFSLIMLDLDYFKKINDRYGHPAGDAVLKAISATINQTVRKSDIVSRYGGEEFAIVLPETQLKGAVILAERLRKNVEQLAVKAGDATIRMTISLGLTIWEPASTVTEKADIIEAADKALYASKSSGRNKTSFVEAVAGAQGSR
jgi:diguanylate cyclase (GGDEF)-like protein